MKIFWFDTETTGTDTKKNDIISLAYIIETSEGVVESELLHMRPVDMDAIDPSALDVNGFTVEQVSGFDDTATVMKKLKKTFEKYVNPYDKTDKFIPAGYNVKFDMDFLRNTWSKAGLNYFGSWFFFPCLPVEAFVAFEMVHGRCSLTSHKLEQVCACYNVSIDAHNAMSDIVATRNVFYHISDTLMEQGQIKNDT